MTPVVIDSSVAIKWFVPEALSDRAAQVLDGNFQLFAPDLLFPECGDVVWKKITLGQLRLDEGREIVTAIRRAPVRIVASADLLEAALEIATGFARTVPESLYVALALARGSTFLTADDRLGRALAAGPLRSTVRSLGEWDPLAGAYGGDPSERLGPQPRRRVRGQRVRGQR